MFELPSFNIPTEIDHVNERLDNYSRNIQQVQQEGYARKEALYTKLRELQQQIKNVELDTTAKLVELDKQNSIDKARKVELAQAEAERKKKGLMEETVNIVREICKDFVAFSSAREYQLEDVVQIIHEYRLGSSGVMNANEMALGKTFETLVATYIIIELFTREHGRAPTILWLTKSTIVETGGTYNEAKRWFPELKIYPLKGSDRSARDFVFKIASKGGICVLTNYEAIRSTKPAQNIKWDIVIMDEVHKLKGGANSNGPTAIWEAVKNLDMGFIMMLTGTPLVNRLEEIWSYLHIFDAEAFPDAKQFSRDFSVLRDLSGKIKFDIHSENLMRTILKGRLIRRTAKEVGLQLPEELFQLRWLQHNEQQAKLYEKMRDDFFVWLDAQQNTALTATSILAQLIRLRQINTLPVAKFQIKNEDGFVIETIQLDCRDSSKLDEAVEIITSTNDQCIVGCTFNEPMEELAFRLQVEGLKCEVISSAHKKDMKNYEVGFQNGEIDVLCINLAMGEGLNLHKDSDKWTGGARAVIFLDKWYNDARNDQFKKRAIRPGKNTGEPVFVYDLKVENSVDIFIQMLCDEKSAQFDSITEDKTYRPAGDWKNLLRGML